jgi:hypothetical protein
MSEKQNLNSKGAKDGKYGSSLFSMSEKAYFSHTGAKSQSKTAKGYFAEIDLFGNPVFCRD